MATNSDQIVPANLPWSEQGTADKVLSKGRQHAAITMNAELKLYKYQPTDDAPSERYLLVSLKGSHVAASASGAMMDDQEDKRGWYTEHVWVHMYFVGNEEPKRAATPGKSSGTQKPFAAPGSDVLGDHSDDGVIRLVDDAPETTPQSGSASVSSSIGLSLSAGAFGDTPTGDLSLSYSISNTFTESLSDFEFLNESSSTDLKHEMRLAMLKGSHPYSKPDDLPEDSLVGLYKMWGIPQRAIGNIAVPSQALFHAPPSVLDTKILNISIAQRLVWAEKTFTLMGDGKNKRYRLDVKNEMNVGAWQFEIPFGRAPG